MQTLQMHEVNLTNRTVKDRLQLIRRTFTCAYIANTLN